MQFLVYLTVLMVSVSTVLLEVHWLTSPPPQAKMATHSAPAVAASKAEGPNAQLSPVYPAKPDAPNTDQAASGAQQAPANAAAANSPATPQKPAAETTGAEAGAGKNKNPVTANAAPAASAQDQAVSNNQSNNRCDIQACASAYKSFRESDCTYQPFDGPRRFCARPPAQPAAREQRDERDRRSVSRDTDRRDGDRRARWRSYDDDRAMDMDDDGGGDFFFRSIRRW